LANKFIKLNKILSILFSIFLFFNIIIFKNTLSLALSADEVTKETVTAEISKLYSTRNNAIVTGNIGSLKNIFDTNHKAGKWGLEHEVIRVKYLKDWSKARGIDFTNVESTIKVNSFRKEGSKFRLSIDESSKFDYIYSDDADPVTNSFGIGIKHYVLLDFNDNQCKIHTDWYTDAFTDALDDYSGEIKEDIYISKCESNTKNYSVPLPTSQTKTYYNRKNAVAYADKYCGIAWGNDNNFKYNQSYKNFAPEGGDCTNFASQILTDKNAGSLRMGLGWFYRGSKNKASNTASWVNADAFNRYILNSGRGYLVKKGYYNDIIKTHNNRTPGALDKILDGDLIGYEKKGDVIHFSVFTGRDSHGYPLVNCHTTDRYKVPWDLGWGDKTIKFILIHVTG
jgi:hypothetical protein